MLMSEFFVNVNMCVAIICAGISSLTISVQTSDESNTQFPNDIYSLCVCAYLYMSVTRE